MLDQLKRHEAVVDLCKVRAIHLDHVDLKLVAVQVVIKALKQLLGALVKEEGPVNEVNTQHACSLLLQQRILLVETGMEDDGVGFAGG